MVRSPTSTSSTTTTTPFLGQPEQPNTWNRLGDPADDDDDNDGNLDGADNCAWTANADQSDVDADGMGDACDPLDNRDPDNDGVPNGYLPGSPLYEMAKAAKAKWSTGTSHFVIRIDALGRFFQDEFTRLMTDAGSLSASDWAAKCWDDYDPNDIASDPAYEPCGDDATKTITLPGGKGVPITVVVIPKQLWTDPPVVTWINDRNNSPLLEIGQHGTYHVNNIPVTSWFSDPQRDFYSCENCGLTDAENYEELLIGKDTLLGNYTNPWVAQSGAAPNSPKIDWGTSAYPLLSFAPPFNASDTSARKAVGQLGFKGFSASVFEENSNIFSPEGSHQDAFDQFGVFHASADIELDPPDTTGDTYDTAAYNAYLQSQTQPGGLTTWLIEEVEWSGRPCQNDDRLGLCNGGSNRENNTVYMPRWNAWNQLLDFVHDYPGGVAMTMGEAALARSFDNAPSVANANQADADHDGIGDVVDGALTAANGTLTRNAAGSLSATLSNAGGQGMAGQTLTFSFDEDNDGTAETQAGVTDANGVATASFTATRPVGAAAFDVQWSGELGAAASDTGDVAVNDSTSVALDAGNPTSGQATDAVTVGATLTDSDGVPLEGQTVSFAIGSATGSGTTDADGHATAQVTPAAAAETSLSASFTAADDYLGSSSGPQAFSVTHEDTDLALSVDNPASGQATDAVSMSATLTEPDGPVVGRTVTIAIGTASANGVTDSNGVATVSVTPTGPVGQQAVSASFTGDTVYAGDTAEGVFDVLAEATAVTLDSTNPVSGQAFGTADVGATLLDDDSQPLAGKTLLFSIGSSSQSGVTDSAGHASATLFLADSTGPYTLSAVFAAVDPYAGSSASSDFTIVSAPSGVTLDAGNPTSGAIGASPVFGASLRDGDGLPLAGRTVTFTVGTASAAGVTDGNGHATAAVLLTVPAGPSTVEASWTGDTSYAADSDSALFTVLPGATSVTFDAGTPASGQYTDSAAVGATLRGAGGTPLAGRTVRFTIDGASVNGVTDGDGHASVLVPLTAQPGAYTLSAVFTAAGDWAGSSSSRSFTIAKEATSIQLASVVQPSGNASVKPKLVDTDSGAGISGRTIRLYIQQTAKRGAVSWKLVGSGTTNASGVATITVLSREVPTAATPMKATFGSDKFFLESEATATISR